MTREHLTTAAEFLVLLTIVAGLVFLVFRIRHGSNYRLAAGIALLPVVLLVWINLAVGIIGEPDNPANLMYFGVPAVGFIGAIIARFKPAGMSRALLAAALAQVLVALVTVVAGLGAPVTPALTYLVLNGILVALWVGSALLFRKAARVQS
jgi:hypothetical protein